MIRHSNKITRPNHEYHDKINKFEIGENTGITVHVMVDMTDDVKIGNNTIVAGSQTQIWTHGFTVSRSGNKKTNNPVIIGDYCYIGSRCCICPGVMIGNDITVGAQTCVSKNITIPGTYVSQPLRFIEKFNT